MSDNSYPIMLWHPQLSFATSGVSAAPNDMFLRNPSGDPMMIDEIRFSSSSVGPAFGTMMVWIRLDNMQLTKGFVPICLLGQPVNGAGPLGPWPTTQFSIPLTRAFYRRELYTWKFAKPLYIPGSAKLVVSYLNGQGSSNTDVTTAYAPNVRMGVYGTVVRGADLEKIPRKNAIPYAAYWKAQDRSVVVNGSPPTIGNVVDDSTRADLVNPFDVDMHVERFMGALAIQNSITVNAGAVTNAWTDSANMAGSQGTPAQEMDYVVQQLGSEIITVQMISSEGEACVRNPVPFGHLFSRLDKSWPCATAVRPKGFYQVRLNESFANIEQSDVGNTQSFVVRPMVSMVGYREVEVL